MATSRNRHPKGKDWRRKRMAASAKKEKPPEMYRGLRFTNHERHVQRRKQREVSHALGQAKNNQS